MITLKFKKDSELAVITNFDEKDDKISSIVLKIFKKDETVNVGVIGVGLLKGDSTIDVMFNDGTASFGIYTDCVDILMNSDGWCDLFDVDVYDPDGWDRSPDNFDKSWNELIDFEEFKKRLGWSTVKYKNSKYAIYIQSMKFNDVFDSMKFNEDYD